MLREILFAASLFAQAQSPITQQQVEDWIGAYSDKYDIDFSIPYHIAYCESDKFDSRVINGTRLGRLNEVGTFQFHPAGIWWYTPQAKAGYSMYDVEANIAAGVWALSQGYGPKHWTWCWNH